MKSRSVFAAAAVVAIAVPAGCGGDDKEKTLSQEEIVSKAKPTVVRIQGKESGGSGVVIDENQGLVLTNAHVALGLTGMKARVGDNASTETPARLVAAAPCEDLAVIRLVNRPSNLEAIKLGNSSKVKTGAHVTALGYPGSLEEERGTGAAGQAENVNATDGRVSSSNVAATPDKSLPKFQSTIQHQAAINPGNSGGPLVNDNGELVGINTLRNPENQGQFYAISVDRVKQILPDLRAGRSQVNEGWDILPVAGVLTELPAIFAADPDFGSRGGASLGARIASIIRSSNIQGMYVLGSEPGLPAREAAIVRGDLIRRIAGQPVTSFQDVCDILAAKNPGEKVRVQGLYLNSARRLDQIGDPWVVTMTLK